MRQEHVAIVSRIVARQLRRGVKQIESRFSVHKRPPFDRVSVGDRLHFKVSGGGVIGSAVVTRVRQFAELSPRRVLTLRRRFNAAIGASGRYWQVRRHCLYGVLIWFAPLTPPARPVHVARQYGSGWLVLPKGR